MKLLVVEDDDRVSSALCSALTQQGFEVICAASGAAALKLLPTEPDLILLDLRLPDQDGFTVCSQIRRTSTVPIVVTTALSDLNARILGLNLGADDYLIKPYNLAELIARIRAVSRRTRHGRADTAPDNGASATTVPGNAQGGTGAEPAGADRLDAGPIHIDTRRRTVSVSGRPVMLTRKEFDLLEVLARRAGAVYRHDELINEVWRSNEATLRRALHVHIASLRHKLIDPSLVESVHGVGYRLNVLGPPAA